MSKIILSVGVILMLSASCQSAHNIRSQKRYYLNGVNIFQNSTEDDDIFCSEVLPLFKRNAFVTYKIGEQSRTKGNKMDGITLPDRQRPTLTCFNHFQMSICSRIWSTAI